MKDKRFRSTRSREITAIIILALAVFLFLGLLSYDSRDPSLWNRGAKPLAISNYTGIVGAYLSDALVRTVGIASAWFPVVLCMACIRYFVQDTFGFGLVVAAALAGLVFSTSGLISLLGPDLRLSGGIFPPGGMLGTLASRFLRTYLNALGTSILLSVLFVISLMITMDLSMVALVGRMAAVIRGAARGIGRSIDMLRLRNKRSRLVSKEIRHKASRNPPVIMDEPVMPEKRAKPKKAEQTAFEFIRPKGDYVLPPLTILDDYKRKDTKVKKESLLMNARILEKKLADFGIDGKVVEVRPGPLITMYELEPAPGIKLNRITNLSDDLAMALKAQSVRIAPIPGKAVVGIEIPNHERESVRLRNVLDNEDFLDSKYRLPIALGEDIVGLPVITDLARMPHLLIAGTTGSGKSVSLNAMICSILFKASPEKVKFLMIDPKRLELSLYEGVPHLLHPVVVSPKEASQVLRWAVLEMERRYRMISETGAKNIEKFNQMFEKPGKDKSMSSEAVDNAEDEEENGIPGFLPGIAGPQQHKPADPGQRILPAARLPYIVIVIDELADLMMVAQRNVEESLTRLAQMARAAGIHLIIATQRPSVDVITGIIKANFPTRVSFQVSSKVDSRTILDQLGAEQLLGMGDMLFMPPGTSRLSRIHGAYVSDHEIERIVGFVKKQGKPAYDESIVQAQEAEVEKTGEEDYDEKYDEAVELVTDLGQASISLVQRYMKIGYNRAARIIEKMEAEGVVGPSDGVKPRKVLAKKLSR